jgi:CHAT domain-containing protein
MGQLLIYPLIVWLLAGPQAAPVDPNLADGLRLVAQLALDASDARRFQQIGLDRAADLLTAVMTHGQRRDATRDDWAAMHRAVDGLIAVYQLKGETLRAAVFAGLQSHLYRNLDEDLPRALAAAERGMELKRASGDTLTLFFEQMSIGQILAAMGRPEEALVPLRAARDSYPDLLSDTGSMLWRQIVRAEISRRDLASARREAEAFAAAAKAAPGALAMALLSLADVDIAQQRFDAALDRVKAARALPGSGPAGELVNLAASETIMGIVLDATRALPYDQALALASRIEREFQGLFADINALARLSIRARRRLSGEFDAMIREETAVLEQARAAGSLGGQLTALQTLAAAHGAVNAYDDAAALLQEAYALGRRTLAAKGPPTGHAEARELYTIANTLGDTLLALERFPEARALFQATIAAIGAYSEAALRRQLGSTLGDAVVGLALVIARAGETPVAVSMLTAALDGKPADAQFNRAEVLSVLARLEKEVAPARAADSYEKAIADLVERRDRRTEIFRRLQVAELLARSPATGGDRLDRARQHLAIVARDAAALSYSDALWRVRFVEGLIAEANRQGPAAVEAYQDAVERLDRIRAGLSEQDQRASFLDSDTVQELYGRTVRLLLGAGRRDDAWSFLERGKARAFLEMLQGRRFVSGAATPATEELRALERRILELRTGLTPEFQALQRGFKRDPASELQELRDLELKFGRARRQASLTANRAAQPLAIQPIPLPEVQRRLPSRSALVEYALFDDALAAFVITPARVEYVVWPANVAALSAGVRQLREALADPAAAQSFRDAAAPLAAALLPPVLDRLRGEIEHLIVVPAGYLAYLPFEVLPVPGGHLVDRYAVSYLPSASTLLFLERTQAAPGASLFVGALGNARAEGWPPLPGTLVESEAILSLFPDAGRAIGEALTRDRTLDALRRYDRVHLATHGMLNEQAPLFSALLMGAAAGGPTRLSLYEIADVPLKAKLVVLSACQTGVGKLMRGDEVTGLTRTFLQAGASAVVSSLWQVADDSTAALMHSFYVGLRDGLSPSRALRRAALETRKRFNHPYYWAPFVLTGIE